MTASPDDVDLVGLIRKTAADRPTEPAPAQIADAVMDQIPPGQERRILAALLPRFVGETLRRVEQTAATDPRLAWEDLLSDRVPTDAGYRFLRDCTTDDIRLGARRRRAHAEGLERRADLYDGIAAKLDSGVAEATAPDPRPRDLPIVEGVDVVVRHRGYSPPMGRRARDLPPGLRPTINELLDELAYIPDDILGPQLLDDPELFEKVALANARGWTAPGLTALLEAPDMLDGFYAALDRVKANLAVATRRPDIDHGARKRAGRDSMAVQERQGEVRRLLSISLHGSRTRRAPEEAQRRQQQVTVLREHETEVQRLLAEKLRDAEIPAEPVPMPTKEMAWQVAVEQGWVTPTAGQDLLSLDDHAFDEVVRTDINGDLVDALRTPDAASRWITSLKRVSDEHLARETPDDPMAKSRAGRFHAALMQRQGEARRHLKRVHAQVAEVVDTLNQQDLRDQIKAEVRTVILTRYTPELVDG